LAAAEAGNIYAQLKIGSMLFIGEGTPKNPRKGSKWHQKCMLERRHLFSLIYDGYVYGYITWILFSLTAYAYDIDNG
jgi:hypothetical protein